MTQNLLKKIKPYITVNKEISNGAPLLKNTRIPIIHILKQFTLGWNIDEIKERYPDVNKKYIQKIIKIISSEFKNINDTQEKDQVGLLSSRRQGSSFI